MRLYGYACCKPQIVYNFFNQIPENENIQSKYVSLSEPTVSKSKFFSWHKRQERTELLIEQGTWRSSRNQTVNIVQVKVHRRMKNAKAH